ncbi:MAG: beta-ketoacyl-[acyl-carrier-protein] synthase family protein [Anaerohalosphaeraceae bacterium]|nr:beta-ketoacyl-[acyl-carrier-protein] synthase family protein [Anaerohalosphaeraceae bacterium]
MTVRRAVITGLGAITPLGLSYKDLWSRLCEGRSGIDTIKAFDASGFTCQIAGEVGDFKIRDHIQKSQRKTTKLMSRDIELAIIASNEAFADAGLVTRATDEANVTINPAKTAICLGAGLISCDLIELAPAVAKSISDGKFDIRKWGKDGLDALTPVWLLKYLPNMLACHVGITHDIQGPSNTITCAEVASLLAIAEATQIIQRGSAEMALAGGGEAKVNPMVLIKQCLNKRAIADYDGDPQDACRPFDAKAGGSVFGEAAANVIIESAEAAEKRGAKIYAELAGLGQSNSLNADYRHLEKNGKGLQIAIEEAISQAGISPEEIGLIIPHGSAIACDDTAEATAIYNATNGKAENISTLPTKSMVSNTGAAGGAIDVIAACCAMEAGVIPAAKNFNTPADGCKLNIPLKPVEKKIKYALCCGYTYGGQTAAVILKNIK